MYFYICFLYGYLPQNSFISEEQLFHEELFEDIVLASGFFDAEQSGSNGNR
jgi:hypothetical protein